MKAFKLVGSLSKKQKQEKQNENENINDFIKRVIDLDEEDQDKKVKEFVEKNIIRITK